MPGSSATSEARDAPGGSASGSGSRRASAVSETTSAATTIAKTTGLEMGHGEKMGWIVARGNCRAAARPHRGRSHCRTNMVGAAADTAALSLHVSRNHGIHRRVRASEIEPRRAGARSGGSSRNRARARTRGGAADSQYHDWAYTTLCRRQSVCCARGKRSRLRHIPHGPQRGHHLLGRGRSAIKWWTKDQAEGAHLRLLYPPGGATDGTAEEHLQYAAERGEYSGEGERVRSDGSTFWAGITLTALRDETGRADRFRQDDARPDARGAPPTLCCRPRPRRPRRRGVMQSRRAPPRAGSSRR